MGNTFNYPEEFLNRVSYFFHSSEHIDDVLPIRYIFRPNTPDFYNSELKQKNKLWNQKFYKRSKYDLR